AETEPTSKNWLTVLRRLTEELTHLVSMFEERLDQNTPNTRTSIRSPGLNRSGSELVHSVSGEKRDGGNSLALIASVPLVALYSRCSIQSADWSQQERGQSAFSALCNDRQKWGQVHF